MDEFENNQNGVNQDQGTMEQPQTGLYQQPETHEDFFEPQVNNEVVEQPVENNEGYNAYNQFENPQPQQAPYQDAYSQAVNYDYQQTYEEVQNAPTYDGLCIAAFVLGICGFFINPLYLVSIAAIVMGIIGQTKKGPKANMAMWGWILGIGAIGVQIVLDCILALFTGGLSFCC